MIQLQNLRLYTLTLASLLIYFQVIAEGNSPIRVVQLGKDTISVASGAFTISSIRPFDVLLPENQIDMSLVIQRTSGEADFHWPLITVDSVRFRGREFIYRNIMHSKNPPGPANSRSSYIYGTPNLPPISKGPNVYLSNLYRYLSPIELQQGNFGLLIRTNFVPGNLKKGVYEIFTTIGTASKTEKNPSIKEIVCFKIHIGASSLPARDVAYLDSIRSLFVNFKLTESFTDKVPSGEILPLQDQNFIDELERFGQKSVGHRKMLATISSIGFLLQSKQKSSVRRQSDKELGKDKLFTSLYKKWLVDIYTFDKYSGMMLMLEGPMDIRDNFLSIMGLRDPRGCNYNIVPTAFLNK